ncbi:hypothetical protein BDZ91DRAFT_746608 [Kalaharituber pfeilii]|nr:hypothetical protein BDZ91DRAFT_746602 [Kalaharituber pfeilii]KAF8455443.1 hypothetical protein BDZ91DRAFT_746608 [Kalaharituber pfeilii]
MLLRFPTQNHSHKLSSFSSVRKSSASGAKSRSRCGTSRRIRDMALVYTERNG